MVYLLIGDDNIGSSMNLGQSIQIAVCPPMPRSVSVSGAGDVNGDGWDDFIIGASGANDGEGKTYLVHGTANLSSVTLSSSNAIDVAAAKLHGVRA
jgi:hypothetical protein